MNKKDFTPDYIFEVSWEVCNKVGGIYTVLSTRAKTLQTEHSDKVIFIGPDITKGENNPLFVEDKTLLPSWYKAAKANHLCIKIGRWQIPGAPITILVDFEPFYEQKSEIYGNAWQDFGVNSLHAYGDYDEASMFSYAAGKLVGTVANECLKPTDNIIYQAHEWMSGLGMLHVLKVAPHVATIFTTHATSIGRSICGNNKPLYEYFENYNGDQMACELNMEAKHSIEKQTAHYADCFTTVSELTNKECLQLLDKKADVVLMNGFEADFVPKGSAFTSARKKARSKIRHVASCLTGTKISENSLIISTSGRNDFLCKGFDVYMEALSKLNHSSELHQDILALIEVPCWTKKPRTDLQERLESKEAFDTPLPTPMITHTLYNMEEDRILNLIKHHGFKNSKDQKVKVILVPCYLNGTDGIFNMEYYDLLIGNDLCIYPSYYEPWGYTPLEAIAFKIPCITTDLSGFGQWINQIEGNESDLKNGVCVIHRTDSNYFDVAETIKKAVIEFVLLPKKEVQTIRQHAAQIAQKALWNQFINYYHQAYSHALRSAAQRNEHK
ncbi:MAG: glycogen/starch synthase [Bacteroidaceae bacterium]